MNKFATLKDGVMTLYPMIECSSWENIVAAALVAKDDDERYHYYDKERKRDVIVSAAYVKKMLEIYGDTRTVDAPS